jgi:hypothetical protein
VAAGQVRVVGKIGRCCYKDFAPDRAEAKRACAAMLDMGKIDITKIEAARRG